MTEINPRKMEKNQHLIVSDRDSPYYGTEGRVIQIWETEIMLELDVFDAAGVQLLRYFGVNQLQPKEN